MTKRIAIIPARGGSKRIKNKNIRDFCGKPMISHVLDAAKKSELFDTIHVSTESLEIREIVETLGFPIDFMRPDNLADDFTPLMPVLKYVTETYILRNQKFDEVWLLMACAPLIEANDLRQAAQLYTQTGSNMPVLAITEYAVPIEWAFQRTQSGKLVPLFPGMFAIRSQDIEKKYSDAGVFTIFPKDKILNAEGAGNDDGFIGFVIPKSHAIDIDDEFDWSIAEAMYSKRKT